MRSQQMFGNEFRTFRAALAVALAAIVLAGCAGLPSPNAVEIVVWQQQERDRLQAMGFPQYSFD
jgi:F0F1-type ATP synthase membrane subunit c/vacuolar-type H+-ATPase subunit K